MKGSKIMAATIASTVIHFFILTLMDTIPLISKEIPQRNLYMVDLVEPSVEKPTPQKVEEVKKEEVKKEAVKKEEVKKEEVKKEEVKKEEPKQETVKEETEKDTVVLKDPNKKEVAHESTEKPSVNDEQQRLAAIKDIEQKVSGRSTDDVPVATDAEIESYVTMVESRIKGLWVIPDLLSARELKAVVIFGIDKQGEVTDLRFKQSSGNNPYDQSVIRAIRKAAPFSPPLQVLLAEEYELTFQP